MAEQKSLDKKSVASTATQSKKSPNKRKRNYNKKNYNKNKNRNSQQHSSVKRTSKEMEQWFAEYSDLIMQYSNPAKSSTISFTTYSKDELRQHMENPYANYKELRNLSRYLYSRSRVYKRMVDYFANMIDLRMRSVIPQFDFTEDVDEEAVKKSYYETLKQLDVMNLPLEFLKVYLTCFREDVFFGCAYLDEEGFFILPLDPDYCKITGFYNNGALSFHMDMSYFSSKQETLEMWGEPFQSMFNAYQSDRQNERYQPMPDEYAVCMKFNIDDITTPLPPFMGIFDSFINLEDLKEITAISDEQRIYKMLAVKIPLLSSTREVNDFAVDLNTMTKFYNKMTDVVPNYANMVLTPAAIDTIDFPEDQATDVNKIENATKNIMKASGGQALVGDSGTTALNLQMLVDENEALSSLLPQTEAVMNRLLSFVVTNPAKVVFHEVTAFSKDKYRDNLIKAATYGVPVKVEIGVVSGFSELEIIRKGYMEKIIGIQDLYIPLQSSNTMNTGELDAGRPKSDDADLTEDGEASRDKADRGKG